MGPIRQIQKMAIRHEKGGRRLGGGIRNVDESHDGTGVLHVAVASGGHRGPGGAVRPGVEVLQSVAFTQLKGEGQLTGHGRLAETERG